MRASSGGTVGYQIGGQATDFVIIVMNDQGAKSLLNNKAKLGADASVAENGADLTGYSDRVLINFKE